MPVMMRIGDGDPDSVHVLRRPASGEAAPFVLLQNLALGQHAVVFEVGKSMQSIDVNVRAADIILEPLEHVVTGDGSIELPVRVTNHGDLAATAVTVSVDTEEQLTAFVIARALSPGESRTVNLPIEIPTGSYTLTLRAETETIEVRRDNNTADTMVEVDYVQLVPSFQSAAIAGYDENGSGVVEVTLRVENRGEAASGPISVGLACTDGTIEGCTQQLVLDSILPGTSTSAPATLTLPQGETSLSMFAGAIEDGFRWGDENVQRTVIAVPHKLPVSLALSADADVNGYWSDGTADVELTVSILNEGYLEVEEPQSVTVDCLQADEPLGDCATEWSVELAGGFGPATSTVTLRVPMGLELAVNLDAEGHEPARFEVPERILGVNRDVWECYSDRPGKGEGREGCGGWSQKTVVKWDHEFPIKVWVDGKDEYIEVLETVMEEVAPLVNLTFEMTDSKLEADIQIRLGVRQGIVVDEEWHDCIDYGGCADTRFSPSGRVNLGFIIVWDWGEPSEYVREVILHELLHVLVPISHRPTYDALMGAGARLSLFDEELIRLNSHPLLKPGMTMDQVEKLLILSDELIDPKPETEYMKVWSMGNQAIKVLEDAGSARFKLTGRGTMCRYKIGPAVYEVGNFQDRTARLVHYQDRHERFLYWIDNAVWAESNGTWKKIEFHEMFDATGWYDAWSNPLDALRAVLSVSNGDELRIISRGNGEFSVEASAFREEYSRTVVIVLDEETYEISRYIIATQPWLKHRNECTFTMTVEEGEYGIEIEIPESLDAARSE